MNKPVDVTRPIGHGPSQDMIAKFGVVGAVRHAAGETTHSDNDRIQAIEAFAAASAPAGYRHIIDAAIADGRSQPADVAKAIIDEIRRDGSAAALARVPAGFTGEGFPDLEAVRTAALQAWSDNASIRAEFQQDQASYLAYRKAEALGRVRAFGGTHRKG